MATSVILVVSAVVYAPKFLTSRDEPKKSEAIIFFVGPDYEAREEKVRELLDKGYASKLIIPLYSKVVPASTEVDITRINRATLQDNINARSYVQKSYPSYFENTHIEALEAKKAMDALGLKSAICVSSPYHMKRIRLILNRVFSESVYKISCVPAVTDYDIGSFWFLRWDHIFWIVSETVKIGWFSIYETFLHSNKNVTAGLQRIP